MHRLIGISGSATAIAHSSGEVFVYDGDENRVKGTVGSNTTTYIGNFFEWISSTSNMKKYYSAGSTRVAMRTGSRTPNFLLGDHPLVPRDRLNSNAITANSSGVRNCRELGNTLLPVGNNEAYERFIAHDPEFRWQAAPGLSRQGVSTGRVKVAKGFPAIG
jgi:hypothetical protein